MTRRCAYSPDCQRAPLPTSPTGTVFANCSDHHTRLTSSWHADARASVLRPDVVGGIRLDSPMGARPAVSPERHASDAQRGASAPAAVPAA